MKPISLEVEAFGPYLERTKIDFDKLNEAGLFLITGSTGGGKTTLLDAMCIALYNRSTGGRRSFADMRCLSADNTQRTEVTFEFSLGEEQYRFHRVLFMRKKRGSDVYDLHEQHECYKLCNNEWTLQVSGAARSVTNYAQDLLRLTAEQFSQVIVLPQGEFLRLLRANSKDKGEILKTLFACESWKTIVLKLGDRQKNLYAKRQNSEAMLRTWLEKHGAADAAELDEQIKALQDKKQTTEQLVEEKNRAVEQAQKLLERVLHYGQLQKEKLNADTQVSVAEKQVLDAQKAAEQTPEIEKQLTKTQEELLKLERETESLRHEREQSVTRSSLQKTLSVREKDCGKLDADRAAAQNSLLTVQKTILSGEKYLADVTQAAELLPTLLVEKTQLETKLKDAEELQSAKIEVENAEKALKLKKDAALQEKLAVSAQDKAIAAAEAARMENSAAALASGLTDGKPCPVCGSVHHPAPANHFTEAISEAELNAMRAQLEKLRTIYTAAEGAVSAAQAKLDIAREHFAKCDLKDVPAAEMIPELKKSQAELLLKITETEKTASRGPAARKKLQALRDEAAANEKKISDLTAQSAACHAELEQLHARLEEFKSVRDLVTIDQAISAQTVAAKTLDAQRKSFENALRTAAENLASSHKLHLAAIERCKEATEALEQFGDKPEVTAAECSATCEALQKELRALSVSLGSTTEALVSAQRTAASVKKLNAETADLDEEYRRITRLHGLLSGQKNALRMPILQYVLSMMLEETVCSANRYFSVFSRGRYALRRMSAPKGGAGYSGLDIEVLDGMNGTCRSLETLSGGEQFLASLSLAFGLSEVVQANSGVVRMDSIFIDEGFGSLDSDTLDTAMKALETIRQSGRVVGIISHVSELRHRIPTMIRVSHKESGTAKATVISE